MRRSRWRRGSRFKGTGRVLCPFQAFSDLDQLLEESRQKRKLERIWNIRQCFCRILVNLHKEAIDAGGNAGARKMWNVLRLPTRALTLTAGKLQTVRHVEDHRTFQTLHDGKAAEVDHKVVISERDATPRQQQPIVARLAHFLDDVL